MHKPDVIIIGAGLSGLCCALRLQETGLSILLLEASDGVGGRVRTDQVDGFLLDRGFQVLLTAYPEAQLMLDYGSLNLRYFAPGALIRYDGHFYRFVDPLRRPKDALLTLLSPIGTIGDKMRIALLRRRTRQGTLPDLYQRREATTLHSLKKFGFSENIINRFFRPFLSGVYFDRNLDVSSRMFEFGFRMFSAGGTALPARGMGTIPGQLASGIPGGSIRTGARVQSVEERSVRLEDGEVLKGRTVVIATEGPETARLLGEKEIPPSRGMTGLYFACEKPPIPEPLLVLNAEGSEPVNNLCVPSLVSPFYAPQGQHLVATTIIGTREEGDEDLEAQVKTQLNSWFGPDVEKWRLLRVYRIPHALPVQAPPVPDPTDPLVQVSPWLFTCGEYRNVASLQWAMVSGRRAAEAVIQSLEQPL
jgi:phytoene dehydrogenase-like protein